MNILQCFIQPVYKHNNIHNQIQIYEVIGVTEVD